MTFYKNQIGGMKLISTCNQNNLGIVYQVIHANPLTD